MKISKKLCLILILSFLLITTQISCNSKGQVIESSAETQSELESSNNIYFEYPVRDYPIGKSNDGKLYWDCSGNDFGNYLGGIYDGFHSGEDWNLKGGDDGSIDEGEPVYSIGIGKVVKVSPLGRTGSLGYLVAIEHNGNFVIPSKELSSNGQEASYKEEKVNKIYSVYIHLSDVPDKYHNADEDNPIDVDVNEPIGYIMDPGGGPHLHFEIRHPDSKHSSNWSMVYGSSGEYDKSNWQKFPDGGYNGYYKNLQKMIDSGLRDPSDFIEANYKSGEEYKSQEEAMPSFKSLSFSDFAIPYPDWPVLAEEREDDLAQITVGINKGSEALVIVGGGYGFLMPPSEQEWEDFEREFKEEGFKILNLQLNSNSMLVEATIKGEELDFFEGAPFEIELYYSEVYHFFEYVKQGKEIAITFFILTLENKWLDYKNIAKYITNAIDSLPLQPPVVKESEEAAPAEEAVVAEEAEEESVEEKTLRTTSREKPATLGETIRVTMDDWLIGEATVTFEIEMVDVVSGDDAWDMVRNANEFNDKPEGAKEYILAKFRFKIIETEYFFANIQEEPLVIYHKMFRGIRGNGVEYPEWSYFSVLGLEPELNAVLYEGDECEGWTFFLVDKDDDNPLAVFEKGGSAETWFKLRP